MQRLDVFTKTSALGIIRDVLGFPNPSPRFLLWYFYLDDGGYYVPKVNFQTLARDIKAQGIVAEVGTVAGLSLNNPEKMKVLRRVQKVIETHKL